jgi:hypothetical protein
MERGAMRGTYGAAQCAERNGAAQAVENGKRRAANPRVCVPRIPLAFGRRCEKYSSI